MEQLLRPLRQTADLAGLQFHSPVYSYGMVYMSNVYNALDEVQAKAHQHAQRLIQTISEVSGSADNRCRQSCLL